MLAEGLQIFCTLLKQAIEHDNKEMHNDRLTTKKHSAQSTSQQQTSVTQEPDSKPKVALVQSQAA